MDLCNRNDIQALLQRHGFHFSKAMGQNFLIQGWVPRDIAAAKLQKASGYPKCLLCTENVGYAGTLSHPARENLRVIGPEDTTVLLGDLSWAMSLEDAAEDFAFMNAIPGRKIILKGNHECWRRPWRTSPISP